MGFAAERSGPDPTPLGCPDDPREMHANTTPHTHTCAACSLLILTMVLEKAMEAGPSTASTCSLTRSSASRECSPSAAAAAESSSGAHMAAMQHVCGGGVQHISHTLTATCACLPTFPVVRPSAHPHKHTHPPVSERSVAVFSSMGSILGSMSTPIS